MASAAPQLVLTYSADVDLSWLQSLLERIGDIVGAIVGALDEDIGAATLERLIQLLSDAIEKILVGILEKLLEDMLNISDTDVQIPPARPRDQLRPPVTGSDEKTGHPGEPAAQTNGDAPGRCANGEG
jgi:hypothetical protein